MARLIPIRWRHPIERLREDIHHAFDRWMPELRPRSEEEAGFPSGMMMYFGPAVDVIENEHEVVVYAELPGMERDDFRVEVLGDQVFLRGTKTMPSEEKKQIYYYTECSYGPFIRRISLPSEVDADRASAEFKYGLLRISLPKIVLPEARKVHIKSS
ncbi:MAG: Hsp20/alpha crystallin family protein [bacterium]